MFTIRKAERKDIEPAFAVVEETFMEFEAPDYGEQGTETFRQSILLNTKFHEDCRKGVCPVYCAFDGEKLIGMMCMREERTHIILAFVKKEYHRKGVATSIFRYLIDDLKQNYPDVKQITLNASPYGLAFYKYLGFVPTTQELVRDGMRFTPMVYKLYSEESDVQF